MAGLLPVICTALAGVTRDGHHGELAMRVTGQVRLAGRSGLRLGGDIALACGTAITEFRHPAKLGTIARFPAARHGPAMNAHPLIAIAVALLAAPAVARPDPVSCDIKGVETVADLDNLL